MPLEELCDSVRMAFAGNAAIKPVRGVYGGDVGPCCALTAAAVREGYYAEAWGMAGGAANHFGMSLDEVLAFRSGWDHGCYGEKPLPFDEEYLSRNPDMRRAFEAGRRLSREIIEGEEVA